MSNSRFKSFKFPETSTPRLVFVSQLSPNSEEQVVKDFFRFCGKIKEFEIVSSEDKKSNEALILFEKESAAKTALMLSNATIGDRLIVVEPYYKDNKDPPKVNTNSQPEGVSRQERGGSPNAKSEETPQAEPAPSLLNNLWAAGIQLTQTVVRTTQTLDSTYGISSQAAAYLEKAKEETKKLDEKFHVTERAAGIDSKLGIRDKLTQVTSTAVDYGKQALNTEQGKRVYNLYEKAVSTATDFRGEALRALNLEVQAEDEPQKDISLKEPEASNSSDTSTSLKSHSNS